MFIKRYEFLLRMARNRGIFPVPNLSTLSAVPTGPACRQPVRLRGGLLGALWAVLGASRVAPSLAERS